MVTWCYGKSWPSIMISGNREVGTLAVSVYDLWAQRYDGTRAIWSLMHRKDATSSWAAGSTCQQPWLRRRIPGRWMSRVGHVWASRCEVKNTIYSSRHLALGTRAVARLKGATGATGLHRILIVDHMKRPTALEALQHPYLQPIS
jgi:hypothetical protein